MLNMRCGGVISMGHLLKAIKIKKMSADVFNGGHDDSSITSRPAEVLIVDLFFNPSENQ